MPGTKSKGELNRSLMRLSSETCSFESAGRELSSIEYLPTKESLGLDVSAPRSINKEKGHIEQDSHESGEKCMGSNSRHGADWLLNLGGGKLKWRVVEERAGGSEWSSSSGGDVGMGKGVGCPGHLGKRVRLGEDGTGGSFRRWRAYMCVWF